MLWGRRERYERKELWVEKVGIREGDYGWKKEWKLGKVFGRKKTEIGEKILEEVLEKFLNGSGR